jgi:hypothetical protein
MINIFIIILLCLLLYQIYYIFSTEGLEEEEEEDPENTDQTQQDTEEDNEDNEPSVTNPNTTTTNTTTNINETSSKILPSESGLDLSKSNSNSSTVSLTDRNLLFLNDRVNVLTNNVYDLSMNLMKLENQINENVGKSTTEATEMVGEEPIEVD